MSSGLRRHPCERGFAAFDLVARLNKDLGIQREEEFRAGAEADHAEPFAPGEFVAHDCPGADAAGDGSCDLADEDGACGARENPRTADVEEGGVRIAGVQEASGFGFRVSHLTCERSTVHVNVQDREKNPDSTDAGLQEFGFLDFIHGGYESIGGGDREFLARRRSAFRVAEEIDREEQSEREEDRDKWGKEGCEDPCEGDRGQNPFCLAHRACVHPVSLAGRGRLGNGNSGDSIGTIVDLRSAWGWPTLRASMKRIRITHSTEYFYRTEVTFSPHRAMLRPREGHDVQIESLRLVIEPKAEVRWVRDIYGNSIAIITFAEASKRLRLLSEVTVDLFDEDPMDCLVEEEARFYPFQYPASEQLELLLYRIPSYPHDGPSLQNWLRELYSPGQLVETFALLKALNSRIHDCFRYEHRDEAGVQLPCQTLAKGSGSCRDYAVFMMEAARHWGFGARFVTGYIQLDEGQHGATHAWTEVYVPGAGWVGFDPTNNKLASWEHVSVGVSIEQEKAMPLSGAWSGPADAFEKMEVSVQVVALPGE